MKLAVITIIPFVNENLVSIIIADVSGKGTTAATCRNERNFHSLAQRDMEPIIYDLANQALLVPGGGSLFRLPILTLILKRKNSVCTRGHCPVYAP
jgi:hypothetical protein